MYSLLLFIAASCAAVEGMNHDADPITKIVFNTIPVFLTTRGDGRGSSPGWVKKTIAMIKKKANSLKTKMKEVDAEDGTNNVVTDAVIAIGTGVEGMHNAMSNQDEEGFLLSCLDLVSSLASLTGPYGKMLADILGMVSGFIKMFQETPKVESQESMIKRVVETAVEDAQVETLQFEISGTLELYGVLADSISHFRLNGNISQEQASEFYNHAFRNLIIFGKLKENIKKYCANANEEGKTKKEKHKTTSIIEKCLAFSNLYCKLSIARHALLVNLAALINGEEELDELTSTANNLLHMVRSEQHSNEKTLQFFTDPMNYKPYRRVVAEFWQNQYRYPVLGAYIQKLNTMRRHSSSSLYSHKVIMVCSGFMLSGACKEFPPGLFDGAGMKGWSNKINSVYIPVGMSVSAVIKGYSTDISVHDHRKVGPLFGPHVFGIVPGDQQWIRTYKKWIKDVTPDKWYKYLNPFNKLHRRGYERELKRMRADWDSLVVKTSPRILTSHGIVMCTEKNMAVHGLCQLIEPLNESGKVSYNLDDIYGIDLSQQISSMRLPPNTELTAYDGSKTYGPFYGPGVYAEVCGLEKWTSIKLKHSTKDKSPSKLCQICSKEKFRGQCDYLTVGSYPYLDDVHGCDWNTNRITSMKLLHGVTVVLYTAVNFFGKELGPYHGPTQLPYVDGYGIDGFQVLSMKVLDTQIYEKEQPKCPFMGHVGFVFDGYDPDDFNAAKQFVKNMIGDLKPSSNAVVASVLYLGDTSTKMNDMRDGRNMEKIIENLERFVPVAKRKFNLAQGIAYAQKKIFASNEDTALIPQTLVLLTFDFHNNNKSNHSNNNGSRHGDISLEETTKTVSLLRDHGIQVVAVAYDSNEAKDSLKELTGGYSDVITFKTLDRLSETALLQNVCQAVQKSAK